MNPALDQDQTQPAATAATPEPAGYYIGHEPPEGAVLVGDKWVDQETGEEVGTVPPTPSDDSRPFTIDGGDAADWVMGLMQRISFQASAAKARKAAVVKNLDTAIKSAEKNFARLEARFKPELEAFAAAAVEEENAPAMAKYDEKVAKAKAVGAEAPKPPKLVRFWRGIFGKLQFVATPPKIQVVEGKNDPLIDFCDEHDDYANILEVTYKVNLNEATPAQLATLQERGFVEVVTPGDRFDIRIGKE